MLDDEKPALNLMGRLIGDREDAQVVGAYTSPSELLEDIGSLMPDLVFLDIEMPAMSGLEMASRLLELHEDIEVVFVTAYRQYALEAFGVHAVDYLLKPVDPNSLSRTIERAIKRKKRTNPAKWTATPPRIVCFGDFEIRKAENSAPIRFPTAKAEELFAYLLVHRNTAISKWTLCDSLWPEVMSTDKVEHKLHVTMHRMKKTLHDSGFGVRLSTQKGFYRMECHELCDYIEFEQAVSHPIDSENGNIEALSHAVELYKGPLFANRDYAWCEAERERISRYFAILSKRLAKSHLGRNRYQQASEVLLTLLSHVPFDEEAHELLLRTYQAMHDGAAFLSHYKKLEKCYQEELGAEPPVLFRHMYADHANR